MSPVQHEDDNAFESFGALNELGELESLVEIWQLNADGSYVLIWRKGSLKKIEIGNALVLLMETEAEDLNITVPLVLLVEGVEPSEANLVLSLTNKILEPDIIDLNVNPSLVLLMEGVEPPEANLVLSLTNEILEPEVVGFKPNVPLVLLMEGVEPPTPNLVLSLTNEIADEDDIFPELEVSSSLVIVFSSPIEKLSPPRDVITTIEFIREEV